MKKSWVEGAEAAAPTANTQLLKIITSPNRLGVVFGYKYASQEAAAAGKVARIRLNIAGTAVAPISFDVVANMVPFMSGSPLVILKGNGTDFIEVINVVAATASTIHRVALWYGEMDFPWDIYSDSGSDSGPSSGQRNAF